MEKQPLVSVIIPTYNWEKYIRDSLYSVLKQNYSNMEILVLDDWSQDNTPDVLKCLKEEWDTRDQIKIILDKKNKWIPKNMNLWLNEASGKYIAVLDQDDIRIDPDKIFKQANFLEENTNFWLIGTNILIDRMWQKSQSDFPITDNTIRQAILLACPFAHSSVMYKRSVALNIWWYSINNPYAQDYKLWLDIMRETKGSNFSDVTTYYRLHGDNVSIKKSTQQIKEAVKISRDYRKYFPNVTAALLIKMGNLVLSNLLWDKLYKEIKTPIKNFLFKKSGY